MNENKDKGHIPIDRNFWQTIGLISGDNDLFYVFRKTERIVTALYLVTNLIKDNDPLKWEIRERCMSLITSTIALASTDAVEKNTFFRFFLSSILEVRTFVNISLGSRIISQMNAEIVISEIDALVEHIKGKAAEAASRAGYVLSRGFFSADAPQKDIQKDIQKDMDKGHAENIPTPVQIKRTPVKRTFRNMADKGAIQKDMRQDSIVSLLRQKPNMTIKDIHDIMPDCSQKTLQRELFELVKTGVLKREGNKRWSRYSLK